MAVFMRVTPTRDVGKARAHVRYVTFRSRERDQDERTSFDAQSDRADIQAFSNRLEDPINRHHMATKAYKVVISLSQDEWQRAGLESWKPVVRETLRTLEAKWGRKLDWIAAEHRNLDHPHCHVVIRAAYSTEGGHSRQLRINKDQLKDLRREFNRVVQREQVRHQDVGPERAGRTPSRTFNGRLTLGVWGTAIEALCRAIERQLRESRAEWERQEEEFRRQVRRDRGGDRER
jgi:hypothetical protein